MSDIEKEYEISSDYNLYNPQDLSEDPVTDSAILPDLVAEFESNT